MRAGLAAGACGTSTAAPGPALPLFVAAGVPTAAVLPALATLWSRADGWRGLVATDPPPLAYLTPPHVLVVGWVDRVPPRGTTG